MDTSLHPLRAFRLRQNPPLTLEELAARVGTTKPNLSRIETGKQTISEALLPKLIAETGISARRLRPDLAEMFSSAKSSRRVRTAA